VVLIKLSHNLISERDGELIPLPKMTIPVKRSCYATSQLIIGGGNDSGGDKDNFSKTRIRTKTKTKTKIKIKKIILMIRRMNQKIMIIRMRLAIKNKNLNDT
jgi:hypothetical protein